MWKTRKEKDNSILLAKRIFFSISYILVFTSVPILNFSVLGSLSKIGNVDEWTQEQNESSSRVIRGGNSANCGDDYPVAY